MAPLRLRLIFHFSKPYFRWITIASLLAMISGALGAQDHTVVAQTSKGRSNSEIDVSLGMSGQLTSTRASTQIYPDLTGAFVIQTIQGTSASVGVLGTFHQSFGPWLGYNVNLGYSRFSEKYSQGMFAPNPSQPASPRSNFIYGSIGMNMYELTAASVVEVPWTTRLNTFAQLGGGVLTFLPTQDPSPYWVVFRPAMVFGTGVNYKLSKHWSIRAEYRGLFYKNPDFNGAASYLPTAKLYTITNEPTLSAVYRFGGKR